MILAPLLIGASHAISTFVPKSAVATACGVCGTILVMINVTGE